MAFLKGAVWGVVIGGAGAAVVSVVAPQPAGMTPPRPPVTIVPQVAPAAEPAPVVAPALPEVADAPPPETAAQADAMVAPDAAVEAPQTDGDTAQPRAIEDAVAALEMPEAPVASLKTLPEGEEAVLPNPQSIAPAVPEAEADIVVDVAPDAPAADAPVVVITPVPEAAPDATTATPDTLAQVEATTEPPVTMIDPDDSPVTSESAGLTIDTPVIATDDTPAADETVTRPAGETVIIDTPVPSPATPTVDAGAATEPDAAGTADDAPPGDTATASPVDDGGTATADIPAEAQDAQDRPAVVAIIDAPPRGLPGGASGVVVRRPGAEPVPEPAPAPEAAPALDEDAPALVRFGAFFDNAAGLPLMSVVLIDDGILPDGARALADVPFPVTVALDPSQPGASGRMEAYAAAGFEVAALAALPDGATAADAAVALEGTFDALPRAVALIGTDGHPLPTATDTLGQVVAMLAEDGRGLLVPDTGLNSGLRAATNADVPATTIFRDLDDNDQDARVIRRFVDQAAFRARQQPGVVLLGRVRPETVSALILWGQANRAGQVALAPLSATLLAQ